MRVLRPFSFWLPRLSAWLVVFTAWLWLVGLIDRVIMPHLTMAGKVFSLPDFVGMELEEAEEICQQRGLVVNQVKLRNDSRWKDRIVVDQHPPAGAQVKPGRGITLVVNQGTAQKVMPDLRGRSPMEAELILKNSHILKQSSQITYRHSDLVPVGVILAQRPFAGEEIHEPRKVELIVSLGPKPSVPVVPDLLYRHFSEAAMLLAQYGLVVGDIVVQYEPSYPPGTILSQEPSSGIRVEEGSKVTLTVANDEPNTPLSFPSGFDQSDRMVP